MDPERRQHQRIAKPFEGTWQGLAGAKECRITDLSAGGCFIETLAAPAAGQATIVTVKIGDHHLSFPGEVLYVENSMGFAVKFHKIEDDDIEELNRLLNALKAPV